MPRPKKKTLGGNIRDARLKRKLTQDETARLSGLSVISMSKAENGATKNPGILTVTKIARALDVSLDSLVDGLFLEKKDKSEK